MREKNKIKVDKIVSRETISTKRKYTSKEIKTLAIIGVILCCIILLNGILTQNKYTVYVKNGQVIREGQEPLSLENALEYLSNAPEINIKKLVTYGGAIQAQAMKTALNNTGFGTKTINTILDGVTIIAQVLGYLLLPITFIINGIVVIIYYMGILFI